MKAHAPLFMKVPHEDGERLPHDAFPSGVDSGATTCISPRRAQRCARLQSDEACPDNHDAMSMMRRRDDGPSVGQ